MLKMLGSRSKWLLITTLGKALINSDFISSRLESFPTSVLPTYLSGMGRGEGWSNNSAIPAGNHGLCAFTVLLRQWLQH